MTLNINNGATVGWQPEQEPAMIDNQQLVVVSETTQIETVESLSTPTEAPFGNGPENFATRVGFDHAQSRRYSLSSSVGHPRLQPLPDADPPVEGGVPVNSSPWLQDNRFDGLLVGADGQTYPPTTSLQDIPPILPTNGKTPTGDTLIFVNGVANNLEETMETMQLLANDAGARVIGVHNATERGRDGWEALGDKLNIGRNPSVRTLQDLVYKEIKEGRTVHLLGHSQGAVIVARALTNVKDRLMREGLSRKNAERLLSKVKVETFGGIADRYPDGPQYVHYVNYADPALIVGLGPASLPGGGFLRKLFAPLPHLPGLPHATPGGGNGAVYVRFWSTQANNHNFAKVYLEHRVPFEQARRGNFQRPRA